MTDWTAGYVADIGYTFGYYTELNPLRARLALLNAGIGVPGVRHCLRAGIRPGAQREHPRHRLRDAVARHRLQSCASRLCPGAGGSFRLRRAAVRRSVCGFRQPSRSAGVRLHRPARHLELDLGREPRGHRRLRAPQAQGGRRALYQLQHHARLGRLRAHAPPDDRACGRHRRRGARHRQPHQRRAGFHRKAARHQSRSTHGQSADCRPDQEDQGAEPPLPGPRVFQSRLASHALRHHGATGWSRPRLPLPVRLITWTISTPST